MRKKIIYMHIISDSTYANTIAQSAWALEFTN